MPTFDFNRVVQYGSQQEWLDARAGQLGGSDMKDLFNLYAWSEGPEGLIEKLQGNAPVKDLSQNPKVQWGHWLEVAVGDAFIRNVLHQELGLKVSPVHMTDARIFDAEQPDVFATSPDFLLIDLDDNVCGLEIKTSGWLSEWKKAHGGKIPYQHNRAPRDPGVTFELAFVPPFVSLQCQHAMMCTGLDHWYVAAHLGLAYPLCWARVDRNSTVIDDIRRRGTELWQRAQGGGE